LNTGPADYKREENVWIFNQGDLNSYYNFQCTGLYISSVKTIKRSIRFFFTETNGRISKETLLMVSQKIWNDESHSLSHMKQTHNYIVNFVKYLALEWDDPSLLTILPYFRKPRNRRERKMMTTRIDGENDIKRVIESLNKSRYLSDEQKLKHTIFVLFLAYTGQRPMTAERLTVKQFRDALSHDPPVLNVEAKQDKNKMEHLVPLHPVLIPYLTKLIKGRKFDERFFTLNGLRLWLNQYPYKMENTGGKLCPMDLRKFFEQKSDELGFLDANKNFIMSHGCSSINWTSYKQFLPKNVYERNL
jgi:integrase